MLPGPMKTGSLAASEAEEVVGPHAEGGPEADLRK
jgi:hypothetical protein